jgi:hypothetical protein
MTRGIVILLSVLLVGAWAAAAPIITPNCPPQACIAADGVLSVAVGVPVAFSVADPQTSAREVIWTFGDGAKAYGYTVQHEFATPGKYTVEALVVYDTNTVPQVAKVDVHVIAAPSLLGELKLPEKIFGVKTGDIVFYTIVAVILYLLTGQVPG